jgi:hypothetical protein
MELDHLKSDYQNAGKTSLSKERIQKMIQDNNHPVLKGIKRQLLIETVLWAIFLAVYYNIFDGHLKSPLWNILLVVAVLFILVHNALGFQIINNPINGETILESLKNYQTKIKNYAVISIATRVLAIVMLLGYFMSTITFNREKLFSLALIALIFPIQIYLLQRVWTKRKNKIAALFTKLKE